MSLSSSAQEVLRSPGEPLDPDTRAFMEPRLGHNFSGVRIHADVNAALAARALNARAYTVGSDIAFAGGQYTPRSSAGKWLLAHELAHVVQQAGHPPILQKQPAQPSGKGDLDLPWKHGDYSLFEVSNAGIRFLVAVGADKDESRVRAAIPAIAKRISGDNSRIKDPATRVTTCIIAPTTTRFALWNGKPVLMLDPPDVSLETAAHEMGHGIFNALAQQAESRKPDGARAANFRLAIADIYARLSHTKPYTDGDQSHPAGLWIADPSQWSPGSANEHPWSDPDEFFASAKEAFQINRKGFESAIARMNKQDPAVGPPARELLALLAAFFDKGTMPSQAPPGDRAEAAAKALEGGTGVSKVEDTIMAGTPLDWLLNPAGRPRQQKPRPSIDSPY